MSLAWLVHCLTASGIVFALLSIQALYDQRYGAAVNWLLLTLVIDGIDGPLSRKVEVKRVCPQLNGDILDLVVDYVTYVLIPALFMLELGLFPLSLELVTTGLILFVGALYFARTDMKTFDNWFTGFPGTWNFVAISLWLLETNEVFNFTTVAIFAVLSFSNVKFYHFMRTIQLRFLTLVLSSIYLVAVIYMANFENSSFSSYGKAIIVGWFIYTFSMSIWRTWIFREPKISID